jgi:LysR family transcriptional regulator, hydrogen peroxide-inducible genes activator
MEMQQIRYFVALCDELNFTRAAQRCKVAQPSLTIAIKALEEELGGPLFHRKPRVALTQLGDAMRSTLQEIMIQVEIARATAKALTTREQPELFREPRTLFRTSLNGHTQLEA